MAGTQKDTKRALLYSPFGIGVLSLVLLFLAYAVFSIGHKSHEVNAQLRNIEAKDAALTARQNELRSELDKLSTPAGVEDTLRDKYPVVKNGEGVVVIVDDTSKAPASATPPQSKGIIGWFKNLFK